MSAPGDVRQSGLLVDPKVASAQIAKDTKPAEDSKTQDLNGDGGDGEAQTQDETSSEEKDNGTLAPKVPTRFHATKQVTLQRVVRDVGQIYEEVVSHFVLNGVPVRVTIDVESDQIDKLTDDQRTAIRENLKTLGFADDDWSMD